MQEVWKPVVGFEGHYAVSNIGRVIRTSKTTRTDRKYIGGRASHGYIKVTFTVGNESSEHYVHRLVAVAFLPPAPPNTEVNHIDGIRSNNVVSNLEWVTRRGNLHHRSRVLRHVVGTSHPQAKLDSAKVYRARQMIAEGLSNADIGRALGVTRATIRSIRIGRTWFHVPPIPTNV